MHVVYIILVGCGVCMLTCGMGACDCHMCVACVLSVYGFVVRRVDITHSQCVHMCGGGVCVWYVLPTNPVRGCFPFIYLLFYCLYSIYLVPTIFTPYSMYLTFVFQSSKFYLFIYH